MKKRIAAAVMTSVMAGMMMVTPTFAANTGSAHTDFSLYVANDPVYTVTVPETVTLNAKRTHIGTDYGQRCKKYSGR